MSIFSNKQKADYTETLHKGISFVRSLRGGLTDDTGSREENLQRLKDEIKNADAIVIGAGAGLSTAAGYTYSGERFERWFFDFKERLGLTDMYSGGFYPFPDDETRWAFWARNIYVNRYLAPPKPVYDDLLALVRGRNYFVITTNVDHCFQRAGFEKERLFYTQGDYGLFQSADGRIKETYDNEAWVRKAMAAQRFLPDESGAFRVPKDRLISMRIPRELIPTLPNGGPVTMNLRVDDSFVEDAGWHAAAERYAQFLQSTEGKRVLFLELGVGGNTPMIIKYPFWAMTAENPNAVYACLNYAEAVCPELIKARSLCLNGDSGEVLKALQQHIHSNAK
jgi:NAD-dependent SIR2 family protein deacetylase